MTKREDGQEKREKTSAASREINSLKVHEGSELRANLCFLNRGDIEFIGGFFGVFLWRHHQLRETRGTLFLIRR